MRTRVQASAQKVQPRSRVGERRERHERERETPVERSRCLTMSFDMYILIHLHVDVQVRMHCSCSHVCVYLHECVCSLLTHSLPLPLLPNHTCEGICESANCLPPESACITQSHLHIPTPASPQAFQEDHVHAPTPVIASSSLSLFLPSGLR